MALNFNVSPYNDDFDVQKEFYKILFKPGYAVQARELTQLQTILGNQITSFAQSIYKEGSVVSGAGHQLDDSCFYVKVLSNYNGTPVDFSNVEGNYIVETSTGKIGYVKKYTPVTSTDPATLHVSIIRGPQTPFNNNSTIYVITDQRFTESESICTMTTGGVDSVSPAASGTSLLFHVNEGVFYTRDTFVYCKKDTVVVGKYTKSASAVIGLNVTESVVDYVDDSSLLDPALGSSNYLAPGADRYKIDLQLTTQLYTQIAESYANFIKLSVVVDGKLVEDITTPIYSEIMNTMAKRTYDTNGDFIVKNFLPSVVPDAQDISKLILQISAGSAFVKGYEIEKMSPTTILIDKAQTTQTDTNYSVNTSYGNFTYVTNIAGGLPTINENVQVEIHNVRTDSITSASKIGTAYIRGLEYVAGSGTTTYYKLFLDSITQTSGTFSSARSFVVPNGGYNNVLFECDIDGEGFDLTGTKAQLISSNENALLFKLPRNNISSLNNVQFYYNQFYQVSQLNGNTVTIQCNRTNGTESFAGQGTGLDILENYIVVDFTTGRLIPSDEISVVLTTQYTAVIDFQSGAYNGHNIHIIAKIYSNNDTLRVKTLVSNYIPTSPITISNTNYVDLLKSDVHKLTAVYEFSTEQDYKGVWSSGTNYAYGDVVVVDTIAYVSITSNNINNNPTSSTVHWNSLTNVVARYSLDNGQRDTYYDHGRISKTDSPVTPISVLPIFDYFTHSGGTGYLTPESYQYPSQIEYGEIQSYTTTSNVKYNLQNCIDFRPRRTDDETSSFTLSNHILPISDINVITDMTYYLGRVDRVVLTRDGLFKVLPGIPSYQNPQPPAAQSDTITLFLLTYTPYTSQPSDVSTQIIPHKRYTMRDISKLDERLTHVEYYTALNLLEQQVNAQTLTSSSGSTLYKNGFIVDAFNGSGVGDIGNWEYRASVDYTNNVARPLYYADSVKLNYMQFNSDTKITSNTGWSSLVTVPYTTQVFVNQPIASGSISANPFGVTAFVGTLKLNPESDFWFDVKTPPAVISNVNGHNNNYLNNTSIETQWNAWQNIWTGEPTTDSNTTTGSAQTLNLTPGVSTSTSDFILNQSVVPYARNTRIDFKLDGMTPNTPLFMYINGFNMSNYAFPHSFSANTFVANTSAEFPTVPSRMIVTDDSGSAEGYITFPSDENVKFLTGKETIVFSDNNYSLAQSKSYAQSTFHSQGLLETLNANIISTKPNSRVTTTLDLNSSTNYTSANGVANNTITSPNLPIATYGLSSDYRVIYEGNTVNFLFSTTNVPPRTYKAVVSGTISDANMGNGVVIGNTVIRTIGTLASCQGVLSVPINSGTVTSGETEYIQLEVDVDYDATHPNYGESAKYYANVAIQSPIIATYEITSPPYVVAGNTFNIMFTANDLAANANIHYVVSGTANTSQYTGTANGYFNVESPTGSQTLSYTIDSDYTMVGNDKFDVTFTLPDGSTRSSSTRITPVKGYSLTSNTSSVVAGNTFVITLSTHNETVGNSVPFNITGVTSSEISGAALTGNFTIGSDGTATKTFTSNSAISTDKTFSVALSGVTPEVHADVTLSKVVIVPINISASPSTVTAPSSTNIIVTNGPANGNYYLVDNNGTRTPATGQIPLSATGGSSYSISIPSAGSYTWTAHFNDGRTVTTSLIASPAPVVTPTFTLSGPSSINEGQAVSFNITATNQSSPVTINWSLDNPQGYWLVKDGLNTGTVNVTGSPDYAAYIESYADLVAAYYDAQNGTTLLASTVPNSIFKSVGDEINAYETNTSFFPYAKTSKDSFGLWHWNSFGKSEGRTLPYTSSVTGTVTVSSSSPATITLLVKPDYGKTTSTGSLTLNAFSPVGQSKTTNVVSTVGSLLPPGASNPQYKIIVGDFLDSTLTMSQALQKYTYYTDGLSVNDIFAGMSAHNKIWAPSSYSSQLQSIGNMIYSYYTNPQYLNRKPELMGWIYWINEVIRRAYYGAGQTSPGLYKVDGQGAQNSDSTGFCSSYGVWVAPQNQNSSVLPGQTHTTIRTWTVTTGGTYTVFAGADDTVSVMLDNSTVVSYNDASWSQGVYFNSAVINVPAGTHKVTITSWNCGSAGDNSWSQNPAFFAVAFYSGSLTSPKGRTPVWDTASHASAENIVLPDTGVGLSAAYADVLASIRTAAASNGEAFGSRASFLACTTDPLSQTFFVPAGSYPNGVFVTGLSLYFSSKDTHLPVFVQIRPTVNGYPSSDSVIPLSTVWKNPYDVKTSADASVETRFDFTDPVYLPPGQYAFVVGSNSSDYKLYYATIGQKQLNSTNIVSSQPNVGVLFKSQNASTWVADDSSDLTFKLHFAQFDTSRTYDAIFYSSAPEESFDFQVIDITSQELDFNDTTTITYSIKNQYEGTQDNSYTQVVANKNTNLGLTRNITAYGDSVVRATLSTTDTNVSPVIDLDRMSLIGIQNIISSKSQQSIAETTINGNASSKYITKPVTLSTGFQADNITVIFDANMQSGTSIEVYARVVAPDDKDKLSNKPWIRVPNTNTTTTYSSGFYDFQQQEYTLSNIQYVSGGVTYNNFQSFSIKVVMYSDNPAIVPQIANFRAIATS